MGTFCARESVLKCGMKRNELSSLRQQPIYHLSNLPPPPSIVDGPNVIEPDILKPPGMTESREESSERGEERG